jgi:hypothetical protein
MSGNTQTEASPHCCASTRAFDEPMRDGAVERHGVGTVGFWQHDRLVVPGVQAGPNYDRKI